MKKELSLKSKTLISWGLFAVVFTALVLIASYCDLAISKILTKGNLAEGAYISSNGFGLLFEALGSSPIYLMISFGAVVWFWWGIQHNKKWLSVIATAAVIAGFALTFKDAFSYVLEAMSASVNGGIPAEGGFRDSAYVIALAVLLAIGAAALLIFAWKNVKPETNDAMFKWLFVIICVVAFYLVVSLIKSPVGRMRFRSMNAVGDTEFEGFTGWWVSNGKRTVGGLPSDSCKSFPSGHTYSAAVIYTLICVPDMVKSWDKKWVRALLWVITIAVTGIVAISRIVVGAHYMSDVLFGGTISFLAMMTFREIFIFKGAHFKAVFCKKSVLPAAEEAEVIETAEVVPADAEIDSVEEEIKD